MRAVRFVGKACDDDAYKAAVASDNVAVIDTLPNGGNVTLRFSIDTKPMRFAPGKKVRDLLDLAVSVYIADEMHPRPDHWTRAFDLTFPVDDPDSWAASTASLQKTLHTLSGDRFEFSWPKRGNMPLIGKNHRLGLLLSYDAVCLFSGGIDSLLGAIQLLEAKKRVFLVGHQAEGITASAQTDLFEALYERYQKVHLVQARVARSQVEQMRYTLPDKAEDSHRPRSFLFLGLAAAVAAVTRIQEIYLPENGLIALNPPLQQSRLGTLSTRTAHPLFVTQFADFLSTLGVYTGSIKNPFLYQSKSDMLRNLDPSFKDLVVRSVSCAHAGDVRWIGKSGVRHCGYCVPCIYRRVAMIGVGWDDSDDYGFDVFKELASLTTHKQSDFRALVGFANRVVSSTPAKRDLMVMSHGAFSSDVGARIGPAPANDLSPWSDMLLRWSEDFLDKVRTLSSPSTKKIIAIPLRKVRK